MIITEWPRLRSWKEFSISIEPPSEPTLEFLVANRHVWEDARERLAEQSEVSIL